MQTLAQYLLHQTQQRNLTERYMSYPIFRCERDAGHLSSLSPVAPRGPARPRLTAPRSTRDAECGAVDEALLKATVQRSCHTYFTTRSRKEPCACSNPLFSKKFPN